MRWSWVFPHFVNVVYYVDWLVCVESSLHPMNNILITCFTSSSLSLYSFIVIIVAFITFFFKFLTRLLAYLRDLQSLLYICLSYKILEKAMAPHSSPLAWKIPWTEEPGRLQSMGSHRVGHDWETSLSLFTFMHWRRKWQPTPVFLPGESQGWGSLVSCRLWSHTESDMTEAT